MIDNLYIAANVNSTPTNMSEVNLFYICCIVTGCGDLTETMDVDKASGPNFFLTGVVVENPQNPCVYCARISIKTRLTNLYILHN